MNWFNVKLIFCREVRDQLRDRRTLFMIAVLPLLLYPLLGMSFFQIAQFMREQSTEVLIVGAANFEGVPPLINDKRFSDALFDGSEKLRLLTLSFADPSAIAGDATANPEEMAKHAVQRGDYDAVVYFPPDFGEKLRAYRSNLLVYTQSNAKSPAKIPSPQLFFNMAKEKSQIAKGRVADVLRRWIQAIGEQNLSDNKLPTSAARPFELTPVDVAEVEVRKAVVWAKVLPFVLLLWALTGAFYPAVDLCAGEKERGTLETLLSSPAERSEIVWGKLLTVIVFSIATAVLNLLSMGITGSLVLSQFPDFGPPPLGALVWLLVALVPVAALFSALCLALAAFARSTKEGQYYLMPLVLVTMPLIILPMSPGVELDFGNSLIPITGVVLVLRTVLEGNYAAVLPFLPLVAGVTLGCCLLAVRWAADQFNSESVLFRESERLDFGLWIKHLLRDREDTPNVATAVFCGVLILTLKFFMSFALPPNQNFAELAVVVQLAVIATPALLMTVMLTRSPVQTLLLRRPPLAAIPAALLLAVAINPLAGGLQLVVRRLYPISEQLKTELSRIEMDNLWIMLLVLAVIPAICEELAFRGFILSGLRHMGHKWRAIVISSVIFGVAHGILQQSIIASLLGTVLGYLAVQTGSILPGILFHMTHNALAVLMGQITPEWLADRPAFEWLLFRGEDGGYFFRWPMMCYSALIVAALLYWFHRLPYSRSAEERLQEAIEHNAASVPECVSG